MDREIRLYFSQIIVRSRCDAPFFHNDWAKVNNDAFTFLTPITGDPPTFGLLYQNGRGKVSEYRNKAGEGILFGDFFTHSTTPGVRDHAEAVLCFEFGTDRMEHWDKVFAAIKGQARTIRMPNGQFIRNEF
ncbi:MAG: hypothetical protein ABIR63_06565 [Sphingomicrobium sp.]